MKGQNNFWYNNAFSTCSLRFLRHNKSEKLEFKLEKNTLGFRNMQEKLENPILGFEIYLVKISARIFRILLPSQNISTLVISEIVQLKLSDKKLNKWDYTFNAVFATSKQSVMLRRFLKWQKIAINSFKFFWIISFWTIKHWFNGQEIRFRKR